MRMESTIKWKWIKAENEWKKFVNCSSYANWLRKKETEIHVYSKNENIFVEHIWNSILSISSEMRFTRNREENIEK